MSAPNGGGDNGLSQLQQLLSAMLSALGTSWLPASGPGPEAALAAAATPLAQAAQIFSGAATQAGSYNPPASSYTAIRGIAVGAITQASQDLQTAAASLSSFAQTATQWLTTSSSPPPLALSFHTGSGTGAPPAVPPAGAFTGGPLTTCLIGVLGTLYKSITDVNASLDVINSAPQGDPAPGTDPASALITGLDTLAALLATAGTYTASIGSSIHDAATQHSTALNDTITDVNTLAAQVVPGRVPSDPDTLASILSRISAVRAVLWPSPGSFTDQTGTARVLRIHPVAHLRDADCIVGHDRRQLRAGGAAAVPARNAPDAPGLRCNPASENLPGRHRRQRPRSGAHPGGGGSGSAAAGSHAHR